MAPKYEPTANQRNRAAHLASIFAISAFASRTGQSVFTKAPYNFAKMKRRRKLAQASRRRNRRA